MSYWLCKNGEAKEVDEHEASILKANGENVTSDPFVAATYLVDNNY